MRFTDSPFIYKTELQKRTDQRVNQANSERHNAIHKLISSISSASESHLEFRGSFGKFLGGSFVAGLIVGIIGCASNGDAIDARIHFSSSMGFALAFWLMFGVIGAILGLILYGLICAIQIAFVRSLPKRMAPIENRYEEEVAKIRDGAANQYQAYLTGFDSEAQKMSARYVGSPLAAEVIEWMSDGFSRAIDTADRSAYIPEVNVSFKFSVYRDRINCWNFPSKVFDFEIKRWDVLTSPLEQAALTRAIASAVQLNIAKRYPNDVSGTDAVTNILYGYGPNNAEATIIYTAVNGNYKQRQGWAVN